MVLFTPCITVTAHHLHAIAHYLHTACFPVSQGPVAVVVTEPAAVSVGGALSVQQPVQSQLVAPVAARPTAAVATVSTADSSRSSEQTREALRFLFGKEGEFLREFLLDEVSNSPGGTVPPACVQYCCFTLHVVVHCAC